jgi:hypothetical protein
MATAAMMQPSSISRHIRLLVAAFIAAFLIVGLVAYSAHGFADRTHDNGHCDLCVHISGTAGAPAHTVVVGSPLFAVRIPLARPEVIRAERRRIATQLPRGPPTTPELI